MTRRLPFILLLVDILAIVLAHHFAYSLRIGAWSTFKIPSETIIIGGIFLVANYCLGGYFLNRFDVRYRLAVDALLANGFALVLSSMIIYWFAPMGITDFFGRGVLLLTFLFLLLPTVGLRLALVWLTKKKLWQMTWNCVGNKNHFEQLFEDYKERRELGLKLHYLGDYESVDNITLKSNKSDGLLLLNEDELTEHLLSQLIEDANNWRGVMSVSQFYEYFWQMEPGFYIEEGFYAYEYSASQIHHAPSRRAKRLIDIICGGLLLVILLPVMVMTALLIKLNSHGPFSINSSEWGNKTDLSRYSNFARCISMRKKVVQNGQRPMTAE